MNIAHVIPYSVTFPLHGHNGRYEWVRQLAVIQAKQGHLVTIYGNPNSIIEGVQCAGIKEPFRSRRDNNVETFRLAFLNNHDIYHSHFDDLHYEIGGETTKPIVYTQHWWPKEKMLNSTSTYNTPNVWAVPPTKYMQEFDIQSGIQTKGSIYHGIDLSTFKPAEVEKSDRLLFVGRISPEKNLEIALTATIKAGARLDIVGKVAPKNQEYWQSLQHLIDGENIRYIGQKNQLELVDLYSASLGLLCPFDATEAFGLVAIESQACGTPIILKRGGSRDELIHEGKTGYLFETESEFVMAINNLRAIKVTDCIDFAKAFDIKSMAASYERLYLELI
jgi:glycosyltransferase involved in cell wall biosynthesis